MSEWLDRLTERMPWLSFLVHFIIALAGVAALIGVCCLAEWVGGNL